MRLEVGQPVPEFRVQRLGGGELRSEDLTRSSWLHLSFHRYAACPVCNRSLAPFRVHYPKVEAEGIRSVALFHSSAESLARYLDPHKLPFEVGVDPEFAMYERFGVERRFAAIASPRSLFAIGKTMADPIKPNPLKAEGSLFMVPADFLVDPRGRIRAAHYGQSIDDSWGVEDLLWAKRQCAQADAAEVALRE